jgi:plasmid stabilization system protein ParE
MTRYSVHFTAEAWEPIQAQVRYIAIENRAPQNASRWLSRLLDAIDALEQLPQRNGLDEQQTHALGVDVYRMVFERTYLVFYTIDPKLSRVNIVSFRHGAKQMP